MYFRVSTKRKDVWEDLSNKGRITVGLILEKMIMTNYICNMHLYSNIYFFLCTSFLFWSQDISLGIATTGTTNFLSQHLNQLWCPPSLLSNGHRGLFSRGKMALILHCYVNFNLM
jgi:hypothetical protein